MIFCNNYSSKKTNALSEYINLIKIFFWNSYHFKSKNQKYNSDKTTILQFFNQTLQKKLMKFSSNFFT